MQLGGGKPSAPGSKFDGTNAQSNPAADWALEAAAEADSFQENTWGNDDLMDVNADEDDWSEWFHNSPTPSRI